MAVAVKNSDLVLKVDCSEELKKYLEKYEPFLSTLCSPDFYFLKEAVYETVKYLLNDKYNNIKDLAAENFDKNQTLQSLFEGNKKIYLSGLQLPFKKACSLDLATGAGKSWAIYGIAQIMLAEGLIDRVLVLCPSTTIEKGLTDKFRQFASDKKLRNTLPKEARVKGPTIMNGNSTIKPGNICVENIHAIYKNTGSSIRDSLEKKGARTLVLNDEAHHIFTDSYGDEALREWKKFLIDENFGFKYIVNFSGTCYCGSDSNDYFTDVIYRYPLKKAIEEKIVKSVEYKVEESSDLRDNDWQKIWDGHQKMRHSYKEVKPITIVITAGITECVSVYDKLVKFISKRPGMNLEKARKKIIWIVSGIPGKNSKDGKKIYRLIENPEKMRQENLLKLEEVDRTDSSIEWIVSVAMLTEGWDVKNVFQIVPHESRAFNSKLLIAQVLGRGLRVPEKYRGRDGVKVRVFNHIKFGPGIVSLVNEVLEIDDRFSWFSLPGNNRYNFKLQNIEYIKDESYQLKKTKVEKFSEQIVFRPQARNFRTFTIFKDVLTGEEAILNTDEKRVGFTIKSAAKNIWVFLGSYDLEMGTVFRDKYPISKIEKILKINLSKSAGDFISYENFIIAKQAFGKLFDSGGTFAYFKNRADKAVELDTKNITRQSVSVYQLTRETDCYYTEKTSPSLSKQEKIIFDKAVEEKDDKRYGLYQKDRNDFRSPLNCVCVSFKPERRFLKQLFIEMSLFDSFIKNPDKSFYSIPYSFKKGTHMKYQNFNPDFFLKKGKDVLVVEIKKDDDDSKENIAKNRDAIKHFEVLNNLQNKQKYYFYFLSLEDYDDFFEAVRNNRYHGFQSTLSRSLS